MLQGNTNTNKRIPLAAFMKWPLAKRQDFIDREMSGPRLYQDVFASALRRSGRKAKNLASAGFFVSTS